MHGEKFRDIAPFRGIILATRAREGGFYAKIKGKNAPARPVAAGALPAFVCDRDCDGLLGQRCHSDADRGLADGLFAQANDLRAVGGQWGALDCQYEFERLSRRAAPRLFGLGPVREFDLCEGLWGGR